ncbi:hypothetical protein BKA93DRAFT_453561 [Sparassis latifolia]
MLAVKVPERRTQRRLGRRAIVLACLSFCLGGHLTFSYRLAVRESTKSDACKTTLLSCRSSLQCRPDSTGIATNLFCLLFGSKLTLSKSSMSSHHERWTFISPDSTEPVYYGLVKRLDGAFICPWSDSLVPTWRTHCHMS